jgi:hypothetical protein
LGDWLLPDHDEGFRHFDFISFLGENKNAPCSVQQDYSSHKVPMRIKGLALLALIAVLVALCAADFTSGDLSQESSTQPVAASEFEASYAVLQTLVG